MKYSGDRLNEISFPLGGIGTGCIGLAGNGRLIDWEIFNRPNKGSINGYSHIAVKSAKKDGSSCTKVLNGDICKDLIGQYGKNYGFGPSSETMCGFSHFRECSFEGEFPIAKIDFADRDFPAKVALTAFNPFIPLDSENSSIPAAFFEVEIANTSNEAIDFSVAFSLASPYKYSVNTIEKSDKYAMLKITNSEVCKDNVAYGDLTLACADKDAFIQQYWYRSGWQDNITTFWREFSSAQGLSERSYSPERVELEKRDVGSVVSSFELGANEVKRVRFVLSWNVPNCFKYWDAKYQETPSDELAKSLSWKNYYATVYEDSTASALYSLDNYEDLYQRTLKFKNALHSSTLDSAVTDAAASTLSVLKSPTVLRLEDGSFYGWEGVNEKRGSCEGTCQHVWNYAYALCFLFPDLERSIRELEAKYSTDDNGKMVFRMSLPVGSPKNSFRACLDGQMGSVLKIYREWKICGDNEWLKGQWDTVKKIIEYAWSSENPDEWDRNKDGVLEGRQHHTLDMELFGPSSWLEGFYLAALRAGARMAEALGHDAEAKEYNALFEKGYEWSRDNLFNGEYFIQKIDLKDKSITDHFSSGENDNASKTYWNDETNEIKYQIADGCEIDQMCAQWHANLLGLGDIFDKAQVKIALKNLYKNNFKASMRSFNNPYRIFALNDEAGAVICEYPEGVYKQTIPIPYCEEAMHGFEYQLAGHLISEGFIEEGLSIVRGVRNRYDGKKRNPYNEMECGSNYARSMASFALLPIFSGFEFDMPNKTIGFSPLLDGDFKCLWSLEHGWGIFEKNASGASVRLEEGSLCIGRLKLGCTDSVSALRADGKDIAFKFENGVISFDETTVTDVLEIVY